MKLLERLFHSKATPEETVVPDEYIKKYPEPSEKVQELLQRVPDTSKMLYQYIRHTSISKEWKYWAVELLEKGIETPGIIQLAGEDLDMFPTEFAELLDTILKELDIDFVHILIGGKIVKTGKADLAKEIENEGYAKYKE